MKVYSILAHDENYVIGAGDGLPWHHSADLKKFKELTMGNNLLMGAKTFLGIARNYYKGTGKQVLEGRTLFVLGGPRKPINGMTLGEFRSIHKRGYGSDWVQLVHEMVAEMNALGIDRSNVRILLDDSYPQDILDRIEMNHLTKGEKLFVAGGAYVYSQYIPYAEKIYCTRVKTKVEGADLVKLYPETVRLLGLGPDDGIQVSDDGTVESNGLTAQFVTYSARAVPRI